MLGLGTSVTNIDSGQIYKELSELANYADLDIHFDFSTLVAVHGTEVTSVENSVNPLGLNNITSNEGIPLLDRTTLSRACIDFPNDGDEDNILDMAQSYTTTGKAMTFFIVFQWDAEDTQVLVANADDGFADYIQLYSGGRMRFAMAGGTASNVTTSNTNGSTVDYTHSTNTPTVLLIQRDETGNCFFFADNKIFTATLSDPGDANFTLGAIGGTTHGSTSDFNGKVCEVGLYDTDIGDGSITILLESLCTKWGIDRRE